MYGCCSSFLNKNQRIYYNGRLFEDSGFLFWYTNLIKNTPYAMVRALILRENEGGKRKQSNAEHNFRLRSGHGL